MIRKVKTWLGIEGVKINLDFPTAASKGQEEIKLVLSLTSLSKQKVKQILLTFKEVYTRGRGDHKRISEFVLADWQQDKTIEVDKNQIQFIPISIRPNWQDSEIEKWQEKGSFRKVLGQWAKKLYGVKSEYFIEVKLDVAKTKLNPYFITRVEFSPDL
ncbi:MAG TPA: hypothetical protein VJ951_08110 [Bacteroidales bacterium]|nr:hypothetical protein [Bacteroidales bacterium]